MNRLFSREVKMEISRQNINSFCRICLIELDSLGEDSEYVQKYNVHKVQHIAHWIVACTSLTVNENDSFPKYLCKMCYGKLRSFHDFRDLSKQSWRVLTGILEAEDKHFVIRKEKPEKWKKDNFDETEFMFNDTIKIEPLNVPQDEVDTLEQVSNDSEKVQNDAENDEYYQEEGDELEESDTDSEIPCSVEDSLSNSPKKQLRSSRVLCDRDATTDPMTALASRSKYGLKFECVHCQRRYLNKENLEAHVRSVHLGLDPYKCVECERTFKRPYQRNTHMREVHGAKPIQFTCPKEGCGKVFARKDTCKMHYRRKHAEQCEEEIVCKYEGCGKIFRRAEYYKKHFRNKHIEQPESKYICEDCGRTFKLRHLLRKHRCQHVSEEKYPFKCEHCEKRYTSLAIYKEHLLRHSGVKKFECPHCGAKKTTRNELIKHVNYHTKERQWPCTLCPKVFNSSTTLGRHDRIVHKSIKRYACRFCDQRFGKPDGLKHHEMRHTGERPHACTLCGRRFIQVVALRAHMRTHGKTGEGQMPIPKKPTNRVKIVENLKMD